MRSRGEGAFVVIIIALTLLLLLLLAGGGFALIGPTTVSATPSSNTTPTSTAPSPSSSSPLALKFSPQPVWQERVTTTGVTPINQTHSIVAFSGNGTITVPDTGETIKMTNNGTAFISPVPGSAGTVSAYGREYVLSSSEDGGTTAITFNEIVKYDPATHQGKGISTAVFDENATSGTLAPFNGMIVAGTHEERPNVQGTTITLWKWEGGIGNNNSIGVTAAPSMQEESLRNTTTTTTSELPPTPNNVP